MPHGPLLAHANMKGESPSGQHLEAKRRHKVWSEYPWEANVEFEFALIKQFSGQRNFWPKDIVPV